MRTSGDLISAESTFNGTAWAMGDATDATVKTKSLAALLCANGLNVGYIIPGHGFGFRVTDSMRRSMGNSCGTVSVTTQRMNVDPQIRYKTFACNLISYTVGT